MIQTVYPKLRSQLLRNPCVRGALILSSDDSRSVLQSTDLLLLVLTEKVSEKSITSYMMEMWKVKEIRIQLQELTAEVIAGERQEVIDCLLKGRILYDPDHEIADLCSRLLSLPQQLKHKKMCFEFSRLLKSHFESKRLLKEGYLLDAYVFIQESLIHWARLAAIESGEFPRFQLWNQVRPISPGIYKLYRELATGEESLEKRMRLILLAEEYSVLTRPEHYCIYLLELLTIEGGEWSLSEIHSRLERDQVILDVTLVMEELVRRAWVEEVITNSLQGEQRYRLIRK